MLLATVKTKVKFLKDLRRDECVDLDGGCFILALEVCAIFKNYTFGIEVLTFLDAYSEGARQRPNPELDFEYLRGDEFGIGTDSVSLSLKHKWELGSKYSKRVELAKTQEVFEKKSLELMTLEKTIDAVISYQRVAQLQVKIESVEEAISTFSKIVEKLKKRSRLNPEETISTSTLSLALNDYVAKLNDYQNEKEVVIKSKNKSEKSSKICT